MPRAFDRQAGVRKAAPLMDFFRGQAAANELEATSTFDHRERSTAKTTCGEARGSTRLKREWREIFPKKSTFWPQHCADTAYRCAGHPVRRNLGAVCET